MTETRRPQPQEWPHVIDFFDRHLRPETQWSIEAEYPLAFSSRNLHNVRILGENQEIRSGAVMKMHIMKCAMGLFKVAAIGSVVTAPEHRNKGYSQQILNDCLKAATEQVCDFAILWTDLYDFYRKLGFELAGREVALVIENPMADVTIAHKILETNKVAPEAILKVYNQHTTGSVRTVEDIKSYLQIPNSKIYTLWDQQNQLLAYAVEGKGADLKGYIHEWGGKVSDLIPLFAHIRRAQNAPITVIAPQSSGNLIRQLQPYCSTMNSGYLGMIKVLNFDNFFQKACRYARSLNIEGFVLHKENDVFLIGYKDKIYQTSDEKDITRIVFGPLEERDFQGFDEETQVVLKTIFPVPFWAWGWDSI